MNLPLHRDTASKRFPHKSCTVLSFLQIHNNNTNSSREAFESSFLSTSGAFRAVFALLYRAFAWFGRPLILAVESLLLMQVLPMRE